MLETQLNSPRLHHTPPSASRGTPHGAVGTGWLATQSRRSRVVCHAKPLEGVVPSGARRAELGPNLPPPSTLNDAAVTLNSKTKALALEKYLKSSSGKAFTNKHF